MAQNGKLIFVTGGVRSGKSHFAEQLATFSQRNIGKRLHYIATGVATDEEMGERILRHQRERETGPFKWQTWEQPRNLEQLCTQFKNGDVLLLDCLTNLLNNELFHDFSQIEDKEYQRKVMESIFFALEQLITNCHTLIVVSNEILEQPLPDDRFVILYAKVLGKLNQWCVHHADQAYLVDSGIAQCMKGSG